MWLINTLMKGIGLLFGAQIAATLVVLGIFMLHAVLTELPKQLAELRRERAEATVVALAGTCSISEPREPDAGGRKRRIVKVPCERVADELAVRPAGTKVLSHQRQFRIAFTTRSGAAVETERVRLPSSQSKPVEIGHRVTISYDPARPDREVRVPHPVMPFLVGVGLVLCLLAAVAVLGRAFLRRLIARGWESARRRQEQYARRGWPVPVPAAERQRQMSGQARHANPVTPTKPRQPAVQKAGWF